MYNNDNNKKGMNNYWLSYFFWWEREGVSVHAQRQTTQGQGQNQRPSARGLTTSSVVKSQRVYLGLAG